MKRANYCMHQAGQAASGQHRISPGRPVPPVMHALGIAWQTALNALPIYLVIRKWNGALGELAVIALASIILKKTWNDRLRSMA